LVDLYQKENNLKGDLKMLVQKENKIGEVVARNFHTAKVFESLGLDFCCGGKKTIGDACREKGMDADFVVSEVSKVQESNGTAAHFEKWEPDFLADYIINNHHAYVQTTSNNRASSSGS
jgi:regulator of cell morphogenesis and NO signaling